MSPYSPAPSTTPPSFSTFKPANESEISKILLNFPNEQSDSDPILCASVLVPTVNLSLSSGHIRELRCLRRYLDFKTTSTIATSLHWLKINERIKYKLISLTCKVLTTNQPQYLHDLISLQPCHNTRFSSMVTLARPPTRSSLKISNRSFRYAALCLWNELPTDLCQPRHTQSPSLSRNMKWKCGRFAHAHAL